MEKSLIQRPGTRIFSISFDFTSGEQYKILQYLQANAYSLMGFKGATGPNQIVSGVPAWFAVDYGNVFGLMDIDYEPEYKVYVFNKSVIAANTTIQMQVLSQEISLGTAVSFHPGGSFSIRGTAPEGIITVRNESPLGTPDLTIGLAARVDGQFLPFCAFTSIAQGQVSMEPNENIVLFAAQTHMRAGTVIGNTIASGCKFMFSDKNTDYDLQMIRGTYGITNAPGGTLVDMIPSGQLLTQLLNK
ncbi:hypothetical protein FW781_08125 (plasmid) [Chryseobacterium panacisoli]|uniref:Uncharacterized protein n=1 Tax=Chryseobacterium panacisoli TaxID=1807141 RepID=A0A5D8ZY13_9FLAO|nr:hypothetical protein [Chryseobacterium panacisoli]TZF99885.1 hypothetical protein FW781_08125 [Chryseobacterium panacisoli]